MKNSLSIKSVSGKNKIMLPGNLKATLKKSADRKPEKDSSPDINLGAPPIDQSRIIQQITESNTSIIRTLKELVENSIDAESTRIDLKILGRRTDAGNLHIKEILISDNGKGMAHDTVLVKFRGLCQSNEDTHGSGKFSGKNGVGVKTLFNFFRHVEVETTTSSEIPEWREWVPEDIKEKVDLAYKSCSNLKAGDLDTEKRKYFLEQMNAKVVKPWDPCESSEQGTQVRVFDLRPNKRLVVDEKELMSMLSTHFIWIRERIQHNKDYPPVNGRLDEKQGMFLELPGSTKKIEIKPFDAAWDKARYNSNDNSGAYLTVTGDSVGGIDFSYCDKDGKIQKNTIDGNDWLEPFEDNERKYDDRKAVKLEDVHFKLQLTHSVPNDEKKLLIQICGSNIEVPDKLFSSVSGGHGVRAVLRGVIYSNNPALKRALRHNRTALEENEPLVRAFWDYTKKVLNRMSKYYEKFTRDLGISSDSESLDKLKEILKGVFDTRRKTNSNSTGNSSTSKNKRWVCGDCEHQWAVPVGENDPLECPECGSTDISRPRNGGQASFDVVWVQGLSDVGDFVAAHYDSNDKVMRLNKYHPDFQDLRQYSKVPPKYWPTVKLQRMVNHSMVALAASDLDNGNDFLKQRGLAEKTFYLHDAKDKKALEKELAKDKIGIDSI